MSTIVNQVNFHDCSHPAHHVLSRLESTIKLKDRLNLIIQQALEIAIYKRKIQVEVKTLRLHAAKAQWNVRSRAEDANYRGLKVTIKKVIKSN